MLFTISIYLITKTKKLSSLRKPKNETFKNDH